jgi:hypothetical protein
MKIFDFFCFVKTKKKKKKKKTGVWGNSTCCAL